MKQVRRFDLSSIGAVEKTPQGFLRIPVSATRSGIFTYKTQDGRVIKEFRPADEVFKEDSLKTLRNAPVTLRHPPVMVGPDNVKDYMMGYLSEDIRQDGDKVLGTAIIANELAINAVMNDGMREVSCGYLADLEETPGEVNGERYDYVQRNIRYNHLAIVDRGRAGPEVRLRLDADDAVAESMTHNPPSEEIKMAKVMLAGQEHEVDQKVADALAEHMKGFAPKESPEKEAEEAAAEEKMKADVAQAVKDKDAMQAKCDALTEELKVRKDAAPSQDEINKRVKARLQITKVAAFLGVEKADDMSDLDLKKAVIKKDSESAELEGKSEAYIDGRFDVVSEKVKGLKDFDKVLGASIASGTRVDSDVDADAARKKMMERDNLAWKQAEKK